MARIEAVVSRAERLAAKAVIAAQKYSWASTHNMGAPPMLPPAYRMVEAIESARLSG